ncbi:MAG: sulfotransferase [Anderseniella sp.]
MLKKLFGVRGVGGQHSHSEHHPAEPVFLLAPSQRSGTNYLFNMLVETSICRRPETSITAGEDFFVHYSDLLMQYVDKIGDRRAEMDFLSAEQAQEARDILLCRLGETLAGLIGKTSDVPILVKTPSTRNIANIFTLFPASKLIILCRDGRDTSHSLHRSGMAKTWKAAFESWAQGVDEAIQFAGAPGNPAATPGPVKWIKYEEAVEDPRSTCRELATFVGRSCDNINWDGLRKLEIYGSSESGGDRKNWTYKTEKQADSFQPIGRWREWNRSRIRSFKKAANQQLIDLGYEQDAGWPKRH